MSNVAEEVKDEGINETELVTLSKRKNVAKNFNNRIQQAGDGYDLSGKGRINVDFLGVKKDIVHDHMWQIPFNKPGDFQQIRNDRIKRNEQRERELFGCNISDERFNHFENAFNGSEMKEKSSEYKKLGVSYQGQDGANRAFSQRNRATLQDSQVIERGQDPLKELYRKNTIWGRNDIKKDMMEVQKEDEILGHFKKRDGSYYWYIKDEIT